MLFTRSGMNISPTKPLASVQKAPVIVIGMHRSGTTLLSRLLAEMGVHMGADTTGQTAESVFFRDLNNSILEQASANWFEPEPSGNRIEDKGWQEAACTRLEEAIRSNLFGQYVGHDKHVQSQQWGWKDPRNTITLPLWLRLFPGAKVIHIVRNGVDVANSLVERDRRTGLHSFRSKLKRAARSLYRSPDELNRAPFRNLQEAFDLWVSYLAFADRWTGLLSTDHLLTLRFEDFAFDAVGTLDQVRLFLELPQDLESIRKIAGSIRSDRAFAWEQDPVLTEFFESCRHSSYMQRFGYDTSVSCV